MTRGTPDQTALLRWILDSTTDGIVVADERGRLLVFNRAAERILGMGPVDVPPERWSAHYGAFLPDGVTPFPWAELPLARALAGEETNGVEMVVRNAAVPQGVFVHASAAPMRDEHGQLRGGVATFRDATAQRAAEQKLREREEELRQAQKLEAVGRLAGGVAHDFNNLLTVILSYLYFLRGHSEEESFQDDLRHIQTAAEGAMGLTRQLLAFSRKQVLQPQLFDVADAVRAMGKMLGRLIGDDIRLSLDLPASGCGVHADPGEFERILVNLVVNACDAMPDGGDLLVRVSTVAGADGGQGHVVIEVADTGVGMTPEVMSRIFEPFFTTKAPGKGTGLGLCTVYGSVTQSGGRIEVDSEPGKGTVFRVYLPRQQDEDLASARLEAVSALSDRGTELLLVVDDDREVRRAVSRGLRSRGYRVLEADGPGDALLLAEQHAGEIALLITDVVMPLMSGTALAERIRKASPAVRVLFMSGYADDDHVATAVASGTPLLLKPFTPERLARRVRDTLDGRS